MDTTANESDADPVQVGEIDGKVLSAPIHVQAGMRHLQLQPLLEYMQNMLAETQAKTSGPIRVPPALGRHETAEMRSEGVKMVSGVAITRAERIADRTRLYNFSRLRKKRKWMKNILVDDSSDDEEKDRNQRIDSLIKIHRYRKKFAREFRSNKTDDFMYYSSSLLSNVDLHHDRLDSGPGRRVKTESSQQTESQPSEEEDVEDDSDWFRRRRRRKRRRLTPEQVQQEQRNIWSGIGKYCIPNAYKTRMENRRDNLAKLRKVSTQCMRECRRVGLQSQRLTKESVNRARKLSKEASNYWRKKERSEKDSKRKTAKESDEQRKQEMVLLESQRQKRKLDFLITQTELYAHFMARKITGHDESYQEKILDQLPEAREDGSSGDSSPSDPRSTALANAQEAFILHTSKRRAFARTSETRTTPEQYQQSTLFNGILKAYQLDGMNWLIRLYEEGLNGILADEMGLGKTIQSLAFLAHLAESCNIWGPFLIVAPASTLHNWQQECARFLPKFKCVPYWGNAQDRKVLRKFWETTGMSTEEGSFHVVITSYQIVVQDVKYFQKIDWHYLVLDEAQAIKSSSSARWKILLGFTCRNRLLLTGTPIQNNMAELWSLLHFIMPTLFDCHEEFNEWFSKDIEHQAENKKQICDQSQLTRLHMILSPFMLRREKKDVENQLAEKVEIIIHCPLTTRQRILYDALKNKISLDDLLSSRSQSPQSSSNQSKTLMNLVMQFRKVCNHPDLIDRRQTFCAMKIDPDIFVLPKLLYQTDLAENHHVLYNQYYVHHPASIAESLRDHRQKECATSAFSFTRLMGISPSEFYSIYQTWYLRWSAVMQHWAMVDRIFHNRVWSEDSRDSRELFILANLRWTGPSNVTSSPVFRQLVFTSTLMTVYGHVDHTVKWGSETSVRTSRSDIEKRPKRKTSAPVSPSRSPARGASPSRSAPVSPSYSRSKSPRGEPKDSHQPKPKVKVLPMLLTEMPRFTYLRKTKLHFSPRSMQCSARAFNLRQNSHSKDRDLAYRTILYGSPSLYQLYETRASRFGHTQLGGLFAVQPVHGFSTVVIPDKETLVTDAGKLTVLDRLLVKLKSEGHRVLIYSQMTRMIDILEQYMWHRRHTYMRLDGSSKISDRRDMIADFQNRGDIFVFLLSTRAGGLGINLTAADTVIFYDSDWNPAVDAQAMDRAHRLGQTRQVTVYRLVTENTIEKRILARAEAKSQIQNMVIKGSSIATDALKPTEVVNLLLDEGEMKTRFDERSRDSLLDHVKIEADLFEEISPKRRGRPAKKAPSLARLSSSLSVEILGNSGSSAMPPSNPRTASLRTRSSNQTASTNPPAE